MTHHLQKLKFLKRFYKKHKITATACPQQFPSVGTIPFRGRERIAFDYLLSLKHAGETTKITFLRRNPKLAAAAAGAPSAAAAAGDGSAGEGHEVELLERVETLIQENKMSIDEISFSLRADGVSDTIIAKLTEMLRESNSFTPTLASAPANLH